MAETTPHTEPHPSDHRRWPVGAAILLAAGVILALIGLAPLAGGIAAASLHSQQASDGFLRSPSTSLSTGGYALTSPVLTVETDVTEIPAALLSLQARVAQTGGADGIFIGLGPRDQVERYLDGVARSEVTAVRYSPDVVGYRNIAGDRAPSEPESEDFWIVSDAGPDRAQIETPAGGGEWMLVVMNRDAEPNVEVEAQVGVRSAVLLPVAMALLLFGALFFIVGATMLVFGAIGLGRAGAPTSTAVAASAPPRAYPAELAGNLSPDLSRALWLVKWFLAIPHYVVLFFLWFAFAVTTIVAWFAILFTGRYPRALFEFNVGVLRWNWRVAFYSYSALGTDEYPPFTLSRTDYPAELDVAYPQRLSRGLIFVKSWLLAIPHLVVVALLTGGATWTVAEGGEFYRFGAPSLLGLLVFVAAVVLLFTGRYQKPLFDLVMGINRWIYRVLVYVFLMRDDYPPFRLDQGSDEPGEKNPGDDVDRRDER